MPINVKNLSFTFSSDQKDDNDILCQLRMLYTKSNRLLRLFHYYFAPTVHDFIVSSYGHITKNNYSKLLVAFNVDGRILKLLYCILRPYFEGRLDRYRTYIHFPRVVRNPHSTLAEYGIINQRSMSPQGTHLLTVRRRNSITSVLVTIS